MDAITLLKDDHKTVERLFKRFEKAGDHAYAEKRRITDQIIEELSKHAAIEEQLFYPATRATVPDTEDIALESMEEHHVVKWVLSEIEDMDPEHERFDAKVTVMIENVRHHVEEEEDEYFPKVREALSRKALQELGDAMESAKKIAPTRPHPRMPDTPPGNIIGGAAAGVADRVGDTVSGLAQGSVSALQDVLSRMTSAVPSPKAATGSSIERKTAAKTRQAASRGRRKAKSTAKSTATRAKKAKSSAKSTATRATKASSRPKTTARRTKAAASKARSSGSNSRGRTKASASR
jgi:hemerythrin superfamily protein